ncbi:5-bromo-4-chloroindolyl phosphate hydrolysis family protein [Falsirhodobacter xinxiangensis]|uniref:5-bromo-4-chloroindolyl phosphate hydrolysis family protein n=1 Tax=Falsirhodobacter xinxiangensis TaxID=2530049 RepID=UPI0010AA30D1|nr:5-bromo-4-chloroindolyl phosphate hydrolysis family protein [Rhodobacter xinxiangensis]
MARRVTGKFSPGGPGGEPHAWDGRRREKGGARTKIMLFPAVLFLVNGLRGEPAQMVAGVAAFVLILCASFLTREGVRAENAYDARRVARRPAFPRKMFGAVLTALGVGAGALMRGEGPVFPVLFGLMAGALHLAAFGLDPLKDKGIEDDFQSDRVARAVDEGEKHLTAMREAILPLRDRDLTERVDRFASAARALFRQVEEDPGDLSAARKYMGVYLMGARDATVKFAGVRDPAARADYVALLDDLETSFAGRSKALLSNDRTALDVEIAVLRERLSRDAPLTER